MAPYRVPAAKQATFGRSSTMSLPWMHTMDGKMAAARGVRAFPSKSEFCAMGAI
jgi:hypothetical protein